MGPLGRPWEGPAPARPLPAGLPLDLDEHSWQEGRLGSILVPRVLPRESSHLPVWLLGGGGVSDRTMDGGERGGYHAAGLVQVSQIWGLAGGAKSMGSPTPPPHPSSSYAWQGGVQSLLSLLPTHPPSHPSQSSHSTKLSSLCTSFDVYSVKFPPWFINVKQSYFYQSCYLKSLYAVLRAIPR